MENIRAAAILGSLQGNKITRVSLDQWSVTIAFNNSEIFIESEWTFKNDRSVVVDRSMDQLLRSDYQLWRLVGQIVKQVRMSTTPPYAVDIEMVNGNSLKVDANSDGYEDWSYRSIDVMIICNDTNLTIFGYM